MCAASTWPRAPLPPPPPRRRAVVPPGPLPPPSAPLTLLAGVEDLGSFVSMFCTACCRCIPPWPSVTLRPGTISRAKRPEELLTSALLGFSLVPQERPPGSTPPARHWLLPWQRPAGCTCLPAPGARPHWLQPWWTLRGPTGSVDTNTGSCKALPQGRSRCPTESATWLTLTRGRPHRTYTAWSLSHLQADLGAAPHRTEPTASLPDASAPTLATQRATGLPPTTVPPWSV